MSTYEELIATAPAATGGVPIGQGTWRFEVDVAIPAFGPVTSLGGMVLGDALSDGPDASVLGTMVLGNRLSSVEWHDISAHVQGCEWERGGDPNDRPEVGALTVRIASNHRIWSPFRSKYFAPGTLIRVVVHDPSTPEWWPQFTGIVGSWEDDSAGLTASRWVDITANEVMYLFGQINNPALVVPVGAQKADARMLQLMADHADIPLVADLDPTPISFDLQSTVMAQNRLSEMYLTADSVDALLYANKTGGVAMISRARRSVGYGVVGVDPNHMGGDAARLCARPTGEAGFVDVVYVADSLKTKNDDTLLLSSVTLAQSGGAEVTYANPVPVSSRRHQNRTTSRSDLITVDGYADADLAYVAGQMLGRGSETYRPVSAQLNIAHGLNVLLFLIDADIGYLLYVTDGDVSFTSYAVARTAHRVTPLNPGAVLWDCDIDFGVETTSDWTTL